MKITVSQSDFGTYLVEAEDGRDVLVQTDYEFPGVASAFGWSPRRAGKRRCPSKCRGTDGTVDCPDCKTSAATYIASAAAFLDYCNKAVDDPGYFDGGGDD